MDKQITRKNPEMIHKPTGYTHVVETTGNQTIYISGQVALNKDGLLVGENDMQAQAQQCFVNLESALNSCGATFQDVVKLSYFLTDMSQIQYIRDVRDKFIPSDKLPASTAVEVKGLFRKDVLLEIEAIASLITFKNLCFPP